MKKSKLTDRERKLLRESLPEGTSPSQSERLLYTPKFERFFANFCVKSGRTDLSLAQVAWELANLRRRGHGTGEDRMEQPRRGRNGN